MGWREWMPEMIWWITLSKEQDDGEPGSDEEYRDDCVQEPDTTLRRSHQPDDKDDDGQLWEAVGGDTERP